MRQKNIDYPSECENVFEKLFGEAKEFMGVCRAKFRMIKYA